MQYNSWWIWSRSILSWSLAFCSWKTFLIWRTWSVVNIGCYSNFNWVLNTREWISIHLLIVFHLHVIVGWCETNYMYLFVCKYMYIFCLHCFLFYYHVLIIIMVFLFVVFTIHAFHSTCISYSNYNVTMIG